jgi:hypothetical protein
MIKIKIIISLIRINFKIFYFSFFCNKKIILFYNPKEKLSDITNYYIKDWSKNLDKKFYIFFAYVQNYKGENIFNISPKLCKFIFGVDIFMSTYVCDYFSNNSKRIYIHHDIYDTPLTKKNNYKELVNKFTNYDFIFTASKLSSKMFEKLFKFSKKKTTNN